MKKLYLFLGFILIVPFFFFGCSNEDRLSCYHIKAVYSEEEQILTCQQSVEYVNNSESPFDELCFFLYANSFSEGRKAVSTSYIEKAYPNGESFGFIQIEEVKIKGQSTDFLVEEAGNILSIKLVDTLYPNESVFVDINYTIKLANIRHRLGYNDKTINFGNFFPIACVYEEGNGFVKNNFAANGDPFYSDVANFEVEITFPKEYIIASSGEQSEVARENSKTTICKANKVRDFCFVLSKEFQKISKQEGKTTVNYYYYDDENANSHLETAVKAIKTFNKLFGEYPYLQLSVVKNGFCFGGMEYPNLVMIADDLVDDKTFDYVIVHEIAHQWWYGLVGNNEYVSAWVDEGLTEFSTALFYEENEEYGMQYDVIMQNAIDTYQNFVKIYKNILGEVDESMNRNLNQFQTEPEYVNCTYTKGMLLFDSLRKTMSERKFFKCLKAYYNDYTYKNSSPQDLIESFSKTAKVNLEGFFNSWICGDVRIGA